MRTSKSIADDFLKRKAQTDAKVLKESEAERAEAERAEAEKADELIKAVLSEKLKEIEDEKAEASKPGDLEIHTVEPVVPIEEKPVREKPADRPAVVKKVRVQEKPIEEKPIEKSPEKPVAREPEEKRKLNLMPPFSPFDRRGWK